ncbi:alpha/beta-hydrolase [Trametes gibbosa]|nr:alpha/beta-hydrolase [Trametes gibbosa]
MTGPGPTVLAGPPGDCCFRTVQHAGTPRGRVETIAGVETYVARPAAGAAAAERVVLFFSDVFGALYVNSQLIMDYWADHGYLVLAADYFEKDSYAFHQDTPGFRGSARETAWVEEKRARAAVLVPPWIEAVRARYGAKKYTCVGYCFGAPYVMDLLKTDWILAGALAHPALLDEDHFKAIKQPLLLSCSEIDHTFPLAARRRAEDILVERRATYFIQVFSGVSHGFALRGNMAVPVERWANEESARGVLDWFNHFCG